MCSQWTRLNKQKTNWESQSSVTNQNITLTEVTKPWQRNFHQSCFPWIECSFLYHKLVNSHFREFGSTSNRPHKHRPRVTTPAQDPHIQHFHLQDHLRPSTRTAAATIGLHNQIILTWLLKLRSDSSHWIGVDQHSTGHNQQPDANEMCCTAWGKWWSHKILAGFHSNTFQSGLLLWPA